MVNKNVICVIDGEAGSCGKAKVCGEIATSDSINVGASLTNSMPNAGHTFVDEKGKSHLFRNIPVAVVNPKVELFIGPSSVIDMDVFSREYDEHESLLGNRKIYVHELVPLVTDEHKMREKRIIKSGSTYHGCAACNQDKIIRNPNLEFFKGYKNAVVLDNDSWLDMLFSHLNNAEEYVLFEGSQGTGLSLNFSGEYPYVTSRNISISNMLQEAGVSPRRLNTAFMVIRPFPIRINDVTEDGSYVYTGGYGKASRLTWSQINLAAKCGFYPTSEDFYLFDNYLTDEVKINLLNNSSRQALIQIFGSKFESISLDEISLIDALEMERLIYKSKGVREYISKIIDLSSLKTPLLRDLSEMTSVTKMERKIFDLDIKKLKSSIRSNDPDYLYLNFFQHLNLAYEGLVGNYEDEVIDRYTREYLNWLEEETKTPIVSLGTGRKNKEYIRKIS